MPVALPAEGGHNASSLMGTTPAHPNNDYTSPRPSQRWAHLRFSAIGHSIEVSADSGTTWTAAVMQSQEEYHSDHFRTYWTPIPAGTDKVWIRGVNWWGGRWHVRDISIWSRETP